MTSPKPILLSFKNSRKPNTARAMAWIILGYENPSASEYITVCSFENAGVTANNSNHKADLSTTRCCRTGRKRLSLRPSLIPHTLMGGWLCCPIPLQNCRFPGSAAVVSMSQLSRYNLSTAHLAEPGVGRRGLCKVPPAPYVLMLDG